MDVCYDQKFCAYTGSHRKILFKNGFSEKFCKIQRKTPVMTLFLVKSHTLARNFTKTDAIEGVFSSSRTVILYNVYDELLLGIWIR